MLPLVASDTAYRWPAEYAPILHPIAVHALVASMRPLAPGTPIPAVWSALNVAGLAYPAVPLTNGKTPRLGIFANQPLYAQVAHARLPLERDRPYASPAHHRITCPVEAAAASFRAMLLALRLSACFFRAAITTA